MALFVVIFYRDTRIHYTPPRDRLINRGIQIDEEELMTRDFPKLPQADNQPISQQPLILRGNSENMQNSFLDAQPATLNALPQFPDMQHPYPDMQQTFTQQPHPDALHLFSDSQQPLLDLEMQQTFAQQALPDAEHFLPDPQQPLLDLEMQQT